MSTASAEHGDHDEDSSVRVHAEAFIKQREILVAIAEHYKSCRNQCSMSNLTGLSRKNCQRGGSANEHHGVLSGSHAKLKELFHSLSSDNDSDAWRGVNLCCSDRTAQQKTLWNQNILLGLEGFCFCRCVISHVGHPYLNRVCHSRPASCSLLLVSP